MTEDHLTEKKINDYVNERQEAPPRLQTVVHLANCFPCWQLFNRVAPQYKLKIVADILTFTDEAEDETNSLFHLSGEKMIDYSALKLRGIDRLSLALHLSLCAECRSRFDEIAPDYLSNVINQFEERSNRDLDNKEDPLVEPDDYQRTLLKPQEAQQKILEFWLKFKEQLTFRERVSVLYGPDYSQFLFALVDHNLVSLAEISRTLQSSESEIIDLLEYLPLPDEKIAHLVNDCEAKKTLQMAGLN